MDGASTKAKAAPSRASALAVSLVTALLLLYPFPLVHGQRANEPPPQQSEDGSAEAWDREDRLSTNVLRDFLARFPRSKLADDAKLYLSLAEQVASIKARSTKPTFVIPFAKLPNIWMRWRSESAAPSVMIIRHTPRGEELALPAGRWVVRYDDNGDPVLPWQDGSILIFKADTAKARWSETGARWFGGIVVEADSTDPIVFAVIDEFGVVHLRGRAKVAMPDGSSRALR